MSRTALGVAGVRARESARPDRLFDDPYAAAFAALAPEPDSGPPSPERLALAFQIVVRTRFYDDWLSRAVAAGIRQVVLLGAGLDTRAHRMQFPPGTTLFELDLPAVVAVKERVLHDAGAIAACRHVVLPADVTGEWAADLETAGFDRTAPTAWLAEGLLVYLDRDQAMHVLDLVTGASAAGSTFTTERTSAAAARLAAPDTVAATGLWRGGLRADLEPWLREHGWRTQLHLLGDVAAAYGRPMSRHTDSGFVVATR